MAKTVFLPKSVDELFVDLSDLKLRIALLMEQEKELDQLTQECENNAEVHTMAFRGEERIRKLINRRYRMNQVKRITRKTLPQAIRVVASILLFCYIGLTVAIAADSSVRIKIMEFFMNIENEYTEFGLRDTGEHMDVPAEWQGYYYPSYIPEGFAISRFFKYSVSYERNDGAQLDFGEFDATVSSAIDTEDAIVNFIIINGNSAMIVQKEPWTSIIWSVDNRILEINYSGDLEAAIQIAESVRMIK